MPTDPRAALTALAYLPYASAGGKLFTSAVDVSGATMVASPAPRTATAGSTSAGKLGCF